MLQVRQQVCDAETGQGSGVLAGETQRALRLLPPSSRPGAFGVKTAKKAVLGMSLESFCSLSQHPA